MINENLHKKAIALDRAKHRDLKLNLAARDLTAVKRLNAFFVAGTEFSDACKEYPVVWVNAGTDASGKQQVAPIAVFGLRAEQNLCIEDDAWRVRYVPAVLRLYPFALARVAANEMVVCVDEGWVGFGAEGQPLFTAEGQPSEFTQGVQKQLENFEQEVERTRLAGAVLVEKGLLRDMRFDATLPDGSKLGAATDAQCSAPTQVQYLYRSTAGGALKPMTSTTALPSDVATTTNTAGAVVPFVVRVETGTMNRGIYQNAVLHDPTADAAPSPTTPPKGWNRKLIAVHGTGCAGGWYIQGAAMGVSPYTGTNLTRLGEGYAVFTNTLNHPTNSCNATVAGETTLMGKDHFIKTYGVPTATVSVGTSGGAYTSLQIADAFPGLLDGVYIDATFPDALAIAMSAMDAKLLNRYYTANNLTGTTEAQMVKVSGHKSARAWYDLAVQSGRTDPVSGRTETIPTTGSLGGAYAAGLFNAAVPAAQRWNASTNPTGARATVFDINRNVYGVDANGYALRPFDNVGVQYGLAQLNDGSISKDQFLEMNEKMGGYDRDGNYTTTRSVGDAGAIARAYQSGLQLGGNGGLASIPVFDSSNFFDEDNFYHYQWFHFAVRERMLKANGDTQNHVMWRGGVSFPDLFGLTTPGKAERAAVAAKSAADGWPLFVQWVDAYKADSSSASQRAKVIAQKPLAAVDGCFTQSTTPQFIAETQTLANTGAAGSCNALYPSWTYTRAQAGASVAADKLKCQTKPVAAADYAVAFNTAELARLNAAFPSGVCDWSKAGVGQASPVPYASFGPSLVNLVFDILKP